MKPYTKFVKQIVACISETFPGQENTLNIFSEGVENEYSTVQDFAILRAANAELFCSLIMQNMELFGITSSDYKVFFLPSISKKLKIAHSCYPKNIKRWLNGAISRKKICRMEFCVLTWCHIQNWNKPIEEEREKLYINARQKLLDICDEFSDTSCTQLSLEALWNASCTAYAESFSGK